MGLWIQIPKLLFFGHYYEMLYRAHDFNVMGTRPENTHAHGNVHGSINVNSCFNFQSFFIMDMIFVSPEKEHGE